MFIALAAPLLAVPLLAWAGRHLDDRTAWLALPAPMASLLALGWLAFEAGPQPFLVLSWPWAPSIGLELSFLVDGLSLFFGLVVAAVGVLIVFYSRFYFLGHSEAPGRFYACLSLFMAAMLGTVFANNLLLLFLCWELTGVASFLLIGFQHQDPDSQRGARMALLVTGGTGLCLLAGIVLVQQATGSGSIAGLLAGPLPSDSPGLIRAALLLLLVGAFGKSAQFPLQFWLPNAMAAPTPVSAYLHSATLVKLGVYLCARMFPIFGANELWLPVVSGVGLVTMTLAALQALMVTDLKAILAWSTVSALGFLVASYGLAIPGLLEFDYLHLLSHVLYKGGLFMVVGAIDHATGTRDLRRLGGLWRQDRLLGIAALIGCASMAGLPMTTGFLSKEAMLQEVFEVAAPNAGHGDSAPSHSCASRSPRWPRSCSQRESSSACLSRRRAGAFRWNTMPHRVACSSRPC